MNRAVDAEAARAAAGEGELPPSPILEWYRIDVGRKVVSILGLGATAMIVGMFAVARLVVSHEASALGWGLVGILCVVSGGLVSVLGLQRVLQEERYVALRVDGVLYVHDEGQRHLPWDAIEDVVFDAPSGGVRFVGRDGEDWLLVARFAGIDNRTLAARAAATRRRAAFGLVRRGALSTRAR